MQIGEGRGVASSDRCNVKQERGGWRGQTPATGIFRQRPWLKMDVARQQDHRPHEHANRWLAYSRLEGMDVRVEPPSTAALDITMKAVSKRPDILITGIVGKGGVESLAKRAPRGWIVIEEAARRTDNHSGVAVIVAH